MSFYSVIYKIFAGAIRGIFRIRIEGIENIPQNEGCIVCANHLSDFDVLILAASMNRQVKFMAKKELFKIPILRGLISALGAFPVDRKNSDIGSIKHAINLIEKGDMVGIYPQGTRHAKVDPRKTRVKSGVGMIMFRTNAPAIPVCIQMKNFKVIPFRKTYVRIGKPVRIQDYEFPEKPGYNEYTELSNIVFKKICEMLVPDGKFILENSEPTLENSGQSHEK